MDGFEKLMAEQEAKKERMRRTSPRTATRPDGKPLTQPAGTQSGGEFFDGDNAEVVDG